MTYKQKELLARASRNIFGTRSAWKKRFEKGVLRVGQVKVETIDDAVFHMSHEFLVQKNGLLLEDDAHLFYAALVVNFSAEPPFVLWFEDEASKTEALERIRLKVGDGGYGLFETHLQRMLTTFDIQTQPQEGKLIVDGILLMDCLATIATIKDFSYRRFICELGERYLLPLTEL
jgi:hypothetical protein